MLLSIIILYVLFSPSNHELTSALTNHMLSYVMSLFSPQPQERTSVKHS